MMTMMKTPPVQMMSFSAVALAAPTAAAAVVGEEAAAVGLAWWAIRRS
jgi:hypothetical protein